MADLFRKVCMCELACVYQKKVANMGSPTSAGSKDLEWFVSAMSSLSINNYPEIVT